MIAIACAVLYAGSAIYFWRRWSWDLAQSPLTYHSEAIIAGFCMALFWPPVLPFKLIIGKPGFMLPPARSRALEREAELQRRLRATERRNRELERELNIQ